MPVPFADRAPFDRESLLHYFQDSAKPRSAWKVGMELEKLARRRTDGAPLPYRDGEPTIRGVLEFLMRERGGEGIGNQVRAFHQEEAVFFAALPPVEGTPDLALGYARHVPSIAVMWRNGKAAS